MRRRHRFLGLVGAAFVLAWGYLLLRDCNRRTTQWMVDNGIYFVTTEYGVGIGMELVVFDEPCVCKEGG